MKLNQPINNLLRCEVEQRQLARLITWRSGVRIPPSLLKLLRGGAEAARQAHNLEVGGSNPPPAIQMMNDERRMMNILFIVHLDWLDMHIILNLFRGVAQLAERRSPKPKVAGSIPATPVTKDE